MGMLCRLVLGALACACMIAGLTLPAKAAYPERMITIVVGFPAGGGADRTARLLAKYMEARLNQTVIVENRPGASGLIGAVRVARSAPDGYTLLLGTSSIVTTNALVKDPGIDVGKDFSLISQITAAPYILAVNTKWPFKDLQEVIVYAKAHPDELSYSSFVTNHALIFERLNQAAGIKVRNIPYRGTNDALMGLVRGDTDFMMHLAPDLTSGVDAGKLRLLAATSAKRLPSLPDVPTVAEQGVLGFSEGTWNALMGPPGMKKEVMDKLVEIVRGFVTEPETNKALASMGHVPTALSSDEFDKLYREEMKRWTDLARQLGVEPQ